MIGGMVKTDCNDKDDNGTFCWSDNTQALVLGAYFYGHAVQFVTVYVAKRYTGNAAFLIHFILTLFLKILTHLLLKYS